MNLAAKQEYYTYRDYLTWPDDVRYQLVNGVPYMMSPGPNRIHQEILISIAATIHAYLDGKPCKVFAAPFDVRFAESEDTDNVFQPDVMVVCDEEKIDDRGIKGAPDFVAEILSPSTARLDRGEKYDVYEKEGVKEYWIIDPQAKLIETYTRTPGGSFHRKTSPVDTPVPVAIFDGALSIDLSPLFSE
ncbi:MAG: Uma2 family endonuclease [Clostridiales Family XIII bacterium]|jgi:Uma2 family endonuclease|nr:Uma2 family endonuclease [Clostridiales Family XIII bacterium]